MEKIMTLYRDDRQLWGIFIDGYGLQFSSPYSCIRAETYGYVRWACDAPEALPKYIKREMTKLVKLNGPKLDNIKDMLALNKYYQKGNIGFENVARVSDGTAVLRRFMAQDKSLEDHEVSINTEYGYIEAKYSDTISRIAHLKVNYKGKIYRIGYIDGSTKPYLLWEYEVTDF